MKHIYKQFELSRLVYHEAPEAAKKVSATEPSETSKNPEQEAGDILDKAIEATQTPRRKRLENREARLQKRREITKKKIDNI